MLTIIKRGLSYRYRDGLVGLGCFDQIFIKIKKALKKRFLSVKNRFFHRFFTVSYIFGLGLNFT